MPDSYPNEVEIAPCQSKAAGSLGGGGFGTRIWRGCGRAGVGEESSGKLGCRMGAGVDSCKVANNSRPRARAGPMDYGAERAGMDVAIRVLEIVADVRP